MNRTHMSRTPVASFTDAWIETQHLEQAGQPGTQSHLLQMRGLKQLGLPETATEAESHLLQMRGLKLEKLEPNNRKVTSHLLQMRGLKP